MYKKIQTSALQALAIRLDADPATTRRARERLEWLTHFAEHGHSVPVTCRHFNLSPVTFYRLLRRFDPARPETLGDKSRRPHTIRGATPPEIVALVKERHAKYPQLSREKLALLLSVECGVTVSVSTIARILTRTGFLPDASADIPFTVPEFTPPASFAVRTHADGAACESCFFCRMKAHWPFLKRGLFLASLLANFTLIGFVLLTAFLEAEGARSRALPATLTNPTTEIYTSMPTP